MQLTVADLETAVGRPSEPRMKSVKINSVCTDSRFLQRGDVFVALRNDRNDGHAFLSKAVESGASALVVDRPVSAPPEVAVVTVADTTDAYGRIARHWRDRWTLPVIGVTGSVGKTTTKELLAAALSPLGPVLKTEASQNSESGVAKALLRLDASHRAAVVEMGMRGLGQIDLLCQFARPTVGVITRIAENHIELLGSMEAIAEAKSELIASLAADGLAVLSVDDPYLPRLRSKTRAQVVTFGLAADADVRATQVRRDGDDWRFKALGVGFAVASPSRHDVSNAAAAIAVAVSLGITPAAAADALRLFVPPPMRMAVVRNVPWSGVLLDDSYNAAPASVRSALDTLAATPATRRIAFLGDMLELGEAGQQAHRALGSYIEDMGGIDAIYTVGPLSAQISGASERFIDSRAAAAFAGSDRLALHSGTAVLVKGSRAVAMEAVSAALRSRPGPEEPR